MTTFFADLSAIAKRYIVETGSAWLTRLVEPQAGNVTIISGLATVEVVSLLARCQRDKKLSIRQRITLENDFMIHVERNYLIVDLSDDLLALARVITVKHPLRTLDAIQLASAIRAARMLGELLTFLSADPRLLTAATSEGFTVDDPNTHP